MPDVPEHRASQSEGQTPNRQELRAMEDMFRNIQLQQQRPNTLQRPNVPTAILGFQQESTPGSVHSSAKPQPNAQLRL
jgi:hypothetical protein